MNITAVVNHARRARRQSTTEDKLDELAKAIEALATVIGNIGGQIDNIEYKIRNLSR